MLLLKLDVLIGCFGNEWIISKKGVGSLPEFRDTTESFLVSKIGGKGRNLKTL